MAKKVRTVFQIIFGLILVLSIILLICNYAVFEFYGIKLLPDYVIVAMVIETISAFAFVGALNISGQLKLGLCLFQIIFLAVFAFFADFKQYRSNELDGVKTVEVCEVGEGKTMIGPMETYHYRVINAFFMESEPFAVADYGSLQCDSDMIFTYTPEDITYLDE